ncbi:histidinol-phosphate transaminase [Marinobacterium jannaschii]|uniref:histidinol-phosphate transaminase n=1 Tax=Marinobacterium jannaschii TaxID=64970 RepID=UPI0004868F83|nr:histidinol-phosphate transaminase [Marinobacterium jannaschii]
MSCDFTRLAVPGVRALQPYQPGKPVEELERELGLSNIVKLASNENPLGLGPRVKAAIAESLGDGSRYPDASGFQLKHALQRRFGIWPEQITLGNGSNDVLELIARTFLQPGDEVVYSRYAFVVYPLLTQACGARAVVTEAKDWGHDLEAMRQAITDATRLVFIANPNNPTGTWLKESALRDFLRQVPEQVLVVLDEAYTEYVDDAAFPDGLALQAEFPNLIVTRTFSKAYGLAALRVGYALASAQITDLLNRVRQPFNVNALAQAAACAALDDSDYLAETVTLNRSGMEQLTQGLSRLGIGYIPSVANFVTADMGRPAAPVYEAMLRQGVIVRPLANYGMPDHLRISIGLEAENQRCLDLLQKVL